MCDGGICDLREIVQTKPLLCASQLRKGKLPFPYATERKMMKKMFERL